MIAALVVFGAQCTVPARVYSESVEMKRKIDNENRQFNSKWTDEYLFVECQERLICLICKEAVSVKKEYNVKRHHETKHASFVKEFPLKSARRAEKIQKLIAGYDGSRLMMTNTFSHQERATEASLRVSYILAKKKRPFTDSDTMKECMIEVLKAVLPDEKVKSTVVSAVQKVPLSNDTNARRVDLLSEDVFNTLLVRVKQADFISIAVDESTDRKDRAQMSVYVRYFDIVIQQFCEELLALLELRDYITGEKIFECLTNFFEENGIDTRKICMLVTDGAPAMVSEKKGLFGRMKTILPHLQSLHCIIHQSVLCSKLNGELETTMDVIIKIVNMIRSTSSLQHRLFKQLLEDNAEFDDLLIHNNIRWLSKGKSLERFCTLLDEVTFLENSQSKNGEKYLKKLKDLEFMSNVYFLNDIFMHLNKLNLELQGRNHSVVSIADKLQAFVKKLELFTKDLSGKMAHFPQLRAHLSSNELEVTDHLKSFVAKLKENFSTRLNDFKVDNNLILLISNPFPEGDIDLNSVPQLCTAIKSDQLEMELIDLRSSSVEKNNYQQNTVEDFWIGINESQFPNLKKVAMYLLTYFSSTYVCESAFSHMNAIMTRSRACMKSATLKNCLRLSLSKYQPNIRKIAQSKKCNFSH